MENPEDTAGIQKIRASIDETDYRIMKLLQERNRLIEEIVPFKKDKASVIARKRQTEVLDQRRKWAQELNLDPELIDKIFRIIIKNNIQKELKMIQGGNI